MIEAKDIVAHAIGMVGTRWHHHGRQPGIGLDCAGLCFCSAWGAGASLPDFLGYGPDPDPVAVRQAMVERLDEIPADDATAGCVLLVKSNPGIRGQHTGVLIDTGEWVHANNEVGRVVRQPFTAAMSRRLLVAAFRFRGVKY